MIYLHWLSLIASIICFLFFLVVFLFSGTGGEAHAKNADREMKKFGILTLIYVAAFIFT